MYYNNRQDNKYFLNSVSESAKRTVLAKEKSVESTVRNFLILSSIKDPGAKRKKKKTT